MKKNRSDEYSNIRKNINLTNNGKKYSNNNSHTNNKPNELTGWSSILDILYGMTITFGIFQIVEMSIKGNKIFWWHYLALIILTIYILEDYCTVRLFNTNHGDASAHRFAIDAFIAIGLMFTLQLLISKKWIFLWVFIAILVLCGIWASALKLVSYRKLGEKYQKYLSLVLWTHAIYFSVLLIGYSVVKIFIAHNNYNKYFKVYCHIFIAASIISLILLVIEKRNLITSQKDIKSVKSYMEIYERLDIMDRYAGPLVSKFLIGALVGIWYLHRKTK